MTDNQQSFRQAQPPEGKSETASGYSFVVNRVIFPEKLPVGQPFLLPFINHLPGHASIYGKILAGDKS